MRIRQGIAPLSGTDDSVVSASPLGGKITPSEHATICRIAGEVAERMQGGGRATGAAAASALPAAATSSQAGAQADTGPAPMSTDPAPAPAPAESEGGSTA